MARIWMLATFLLAALFSHISGDRDLDLDYEFPDVSPVFLSTPETFHAKEGDNIILPCHIQDIGPYVVIWKRGDRIISVGSSVVVLDRRYRLMGSTNSGIGGVRRHGDKSVHSLAIDGIRARDNGTFRCMLSTVPPIELEHAVDVLYGPKIQISPETDTVVAREGEAVAFKCHARGKPTPKVYWKKRDNVLKVEGDTYNITGVTWREAGVYECHADNGVGNQAVAAVSLQVHYAPEVEVEKSTIHTGEGQQVKLTCYVHSNPPAEVIWSRDGTNLDSQRHLQRSGSVMMSRSPRPHHVLDITSVQRDDFDTYTCNASNVLGSSKGRMLLTGVADRVSVTSVPIGGAPDTYELSWQVHSFSSILEYKVAYRRAKFNSTIDKPSPWKEVIVPNTGVEPATRRMLSKQQITLRHLHPATLYDLYIQARNKHGWNAVSDMFHFSTISRGAALESRVASAAVGQLCLTEVILLAFVIVPLIL